LLLFAALGAAHTIAICLTGLTTLFAASHTGVFCGLGRSGITSFAPVVHALKYSFAAIAGGFPFSHYYSTGE